MAKLTPVCVDLETFWSQTHSLSKMNPIAYCTNQETELISIAYKFANDKPHCIVGEQDIKSWAKAVDWSDKLVYGHNLSGFDAMILRWRLGLRPAMWGCTLAMARPLHAITVGGVSGQTGCALQARRQGPDRPHGHQGAPPQRLHAAGGRGDAHTCGPEARRYGAHVTHNAGIKPRETSA